MSLPFLREATDNLTTNNCSVYTHVRWKTRALWKSIDGADLAATQESLHTTQNSLSDCFNEVAVVRSDLERNIADTEARLKNDIRQKQQEAFEKIGAVEQQAELRKQREQPQLLLMLGSQAHELLILLRLLSEAQIVR